MPQGLPADRLQYKTEQKNSVDILLLIILGVGFIMGLITGAAKQVISLAAFLGGFFIAGLYYQELGAKLSGVIPSATFCSVVAYLLLLVAVPIVANLIASLLTKAMDILVVPGLMNRLLGGVLGLAKYALVLGALIWLLSSLKLLSNEIVSNSRLYQPLKALPELVYRHLLN